MEIDKKVIKKLIEALEDLKKSLKPDQISDVKNVEEKKIEKHLDYLENLQKKDV